MGPVGSDASAPSDIFIEPRPLPIDRGQIVVESTSSGAANASTASVEALRGPESPTLAERFILAFRLPYAIGCILVGFGLFGVFDVAFTIYVQTSNLSKALAAALAPSSLLTDLLIAYAFYAPRYMRRKLVEAGRALSPLLPDREGEFRGIFSEVAAPRPQLIAWFLFLVALLVAVNAAAILGTGPSPFVFNAGPGSGLEFAASIYDILSLAVATLGLSSVVWTFWSTSLGIHRFGSAPLTLRPYYEDAFLGLKPLGALSLSLALGYFVFIGLFLLAVTGSPSTPTPADILGVGGFLSGLVLLGLVLFFLPLRRLHQRMLHQKQQESARLRPKLKPVFEDGAGSQAPQDVGHLYRVDMMDRKVSAMAVWPYDVGILGRLSAITLSIVAILISRIIAFIFHF